MKNAITTSNYSKKVQAYEQTLYEIERLAQNVNLPEEIIKEIKGFHSKLKKYEIKKHEVKLISLKGKLIGKEEIKKILVDATGYTRWSVVEEDRESREEERGYGSEWLVKNFGVSFDEEKVKYFTAERSTQNRDEIYLIDFTVLPGSVYMSFDTDRVGYDIKYLVPNKDIKKEVAAQFVE